jgi:hypothetical protein
MCLVWAHRSLSRPCRAHEHKMHFTDEHHSRWLALAGNVWEKGSGTVWVINPKRLHSDFIQGVTVGHTALPALQHVESVGR